MPRTSAPVLSDQQRNAAVRRVCRTFRLTGTAERAAGLGWYATAWDAAGTIARAMVGARVWATMSADARRALTVQVAGVIAALSPRCQWSTNVAWAAAVVHAARTGAPMPRVHTKTMRRQAWRIANGEHPLAVLHGPKVRAFWANITGDTDAVTVDVWAVRAARGDRAVRGADGRMSWADDGRVSEREYRAYADVYRRAARRLGVTPRECQAAVWVAVRGVRPTDAGFHADAALVAA